MELSSEAMRRGERELAKAALDESILLINAVFGTTPESRKARTLFFAEDTKQFKGDPYERVMVFLYRGVLYMQDGDYDNAKACFRSGNLQDAFAEEEQNRADWISLDYLLAVCEQEQGRAFFADEAYRRAAAQWKPMHTAYAGLVGNTNGLPSELPPLPPREANLLVVTSIGRGPQKIRVGDAGEYQGIRRSMNQGSFNPIGAGGIKTSPVVLDSLYYQAKTRGGRAFDRIQRKKVLFRDVTSAVGDVGMIGGYFIGLAAADADNEGAVLVGLGILAVGLAAKGLSLLTKTAADIRTWQSLPDSVGVAIWSIDQPQAIVSLDGGAAAVPLAAPGRGLTVVLAFTGPSGAILAPERPVLRGPRLQPGIAPPAAPLPTEPAATAPASAPERTTP
jgi:tetratricopeptide (TPR) repeat protein